MQKVLSSMFPKEKFDNLNKIDGIIAIIFYVYFILITCIFLKLFKTGYIHLPSEKEIAQIVLGLIICLPSFMVLFIILYVRKQKWSTVGLSRAGFKSSILIGIVNKSIKTKFLEKRRSTAKNRSQ